MKVSAESPDLRVRIAELGNGAYALRMDDTMLNRATSFVRCAAMAKEDVLPYHKWLDLGAPMSSTFDSAQHPNRRGFREPLREDRVTLTVPFATLVTMGGSTTMMVDEETMYRPSKLIATEFSLASPPILSTEAVARACGHVRVQGPGKLTILYADNLMIEATNGAKVVILRGGRNVVIEAEGRNTTVRMCGDYTGLQSIEAVDGAYVWSNCRHSDQLSVSMVQSFAPLGGVSEKPHVDLHQSGEGPRAFQFFAGYDNPAFRFNGREVVVSQGVPQSMQLCR